jgi:hypothetical protein
MPWTSGPQMTTTEPLPTLNDAVLHANSEAYRWLVARASEVDARRSPELALACVTQAACFASVFHPGRFADGALENIAYKIGLSAQSQTDAPRAARPPAHRTARRVLHVTPLITLGGHSPFIEHWITADRSSVHAVALTGQEGAIPSGWSSTVASAGAQVLVLDGESAIARAMQLRAIARDFDLVLWHVICPEVVPIVAFAAPDLPPVAIVDHCDHQFWLGSSVADFLVNLRGTGLKHTAARRCIDKSLVVPIQLQDASSGFTREEARQFLGIEHENVLLSVGRAIKFRPCSSYDFVATLGRLLERTPSTVAYVAGESRDGITPFLRSSVHPRLRFVGRLDQRELAVYRAAADVYVESFPYGSQTALLESALSGLPVVPAYSPLAPTLVASDDAISTVLSNPATEEEYIQRAQALLARPAVRSAEGARLRRLLLANNVGDGWLSGLAALYRRTDTLVHTPRAIPQLTCLALPIDLGLASWSAVADSRGTPITARRLTRHDALCHASYVAKHAGDYRKARAHALRAAMARPSDVKWTRLYASAALNTLRQIGA